MRCSSGFKGRVAVYEVMVMTDTLKEYVLNGASATEIKQSVVGRGRADKTQVQHMMKVLLGLPEVPEADAADALACAITHIHHAQVAQKIARAAT